MLRILRVMFEPNNGTGKYPGSIDSDRRPWTQGKTLQISPRTEVISHVIVCTHSFTRGEASSQTLARCTNLWARGSAEGQARSISLHRESARTLISPGDFGRKPSNVSISLKSGSLTTTTLLHWYDSSPAYPGRKENIPPLVPIASASSRLRDKSNVHLPDA
jgi:hypothetical protein